MSLLIFPWWLAGLLAVGAAAIPILIHLLHRQKTTPVLWGAMQFLKQSPLQQKRRKKVDHWLLMLLRVLVVVFLVLLLAWPRPAWTLGLLSGTGGTDVAVVIDHSLSTGRRSGDATVFQQSVAAVEQLVREGKLKPADTLSVVLAEHQPRKLTPRPVAPGSLARVVADLRRVKPGLSDASIPDAIQAAREVVSHGRNARKAVVVLSDEQRVGWRVNDLTAWTAAVGPRVKGVEPDLKVYGLPVVADAQAANAAVTDLTVTPALIGTARAASITATVLNSGSKDVPSQTAKLTVDGKQVAQQPVPALSPGQSQTLRFEYTFTNPFSNWLQVEIDGADGLEADNAAVASAYVWQSLPVLVIDGQLSGIGPADASGGSLTAMRTFKGSRFLLNAMLSDASDPDATPLVKPTVISALDAKLPDLKLEDYAAVVVNDAPKLPSSVLAKLPDYARSGHGVWFILGKNTDRDFIRDGLAQAGLFNVDLKEGQAAAETAPTLDVKDPHNGMVDTLGASENSVLSGVKTYRWWSLASRTPDGKVVVAAAGTNDPLILERPIGSNGGRVVLWTTSVDGTWNNWPGMKVFPPLVNVTLYHLAAGQTKGMENRRLASGQAIVWTGPATPAIGKAEIVLPDGTKVERRPVVRDNRQIVTFDKTYLPGKYELRFDQSAVPQPVFYGVGLDRSELDPAAMTEDDRKWLSAEEHKFVQERLEPGKSLAVALGGGTSDERGWIWPWLGGAVLAFLLGETYMTYRMIRRQKGPAGVDTLIGRPATAAAAASA